MLIQYTYTQVYLHKKQDHSITALHTFKQLDFKSLSFDSFRYVIV
jgi:hypothetical protein